MHRNLLIFFHLHQLTKYFVEEERINCDSDIVCNVYVALVCIKGITHNHFRCTHKICAEHNLTVGG